MPVAVHLYVARDAVHGAGAQFGSRLRASAAGPVVTLALTEAVAMPALDSLPVRAIRMLLVSAQASCALKQCWWAKPEGGVAVDRTAGIEMRSRWEEGTLALEAVPHRGVRFEAGALRVLLAQIRCSLVSGDPIEALLKTS